jgi:hypothetical protein
VLNEATGPAGQYILSSAIQQMPAKTFQNTSAIAHGETHA